MFRDLLFSVPYIFFHDFKEFRYLWMSPSWFISKPKYIKVYTFITFCIGKPLWKCYTNFSLIDRSHDKIETFSTKLQQCYTLFWHMKLFTLSGLFQLIFYTVVQKFTLHTIKYFKKCGDSIVMNLRLYDCLIASFSVLLMKNVQIYF